jgi:3'-phosphoadenosine 5'-phosphosulfate (PAPS) 3'-phosphatase
MLNVAIKAARTAGTIINRAALDIESVRVSAKQTNDFVTEVDVAAENAIIDTLPKSPASAKANSVVQTTFGSSIRWTAPPTSSTACPCTA